MEQLKAIGFIGVCALGLFILFSVMCGTETKASEVEKVQLNYDNPVAKEKNRIATAKANKAQTEYLAQKNAVATPEPTQNVTIEEVTAIVKQVWEQNNTANNREGYAVAMILNRYGEKGIDMLDKHCPKFRFSTERPVDADSAEMYDIFVDLFYTLGSDEPEAEATTLCVNWVIGAYNPIAELVK